MMTCQPVLTYCHNENPHGIHVPIPACLARRKYACERPFLQAHPSGNLGQQGMPTRLIEQSGNRPAFPGCGPVSAYQSHAFPGVRRALHWHGAFPAQRQSILTLHCPSIRHRAALAISPTAESAAYDRGSAPFPACRRHRPPASSRRYRFSSPVQALRRQGGALMANTDDESTTRALLTPPVHRERSRKATFSMADRQGILPWSRRGTRRCGLRRHTRGGKQACRKMLPSD